jgi:predicted AlkP superfamily phosphohydrolase/phosphomutase
MMIPRWTVYPALALIGGFLFAAIPHPRHEDPFAGAASSKEPRATAHPQVVVLGIDGMDPDILAEVMQLYPGRMPNFRWLIESADGIKALGTSTPPQSPVAWSNFITGENPGGHGIFDFIHRDPMTRAPAPSTTVVGEAGSIPLPGPWLIPTGGESSSNRSGQSFWTLLLEQDIPADIWRMPANFPVEPSKGLSFPGMMTPALDSAYGECSFFTTDPSLSTELKDAHPSIAGKVTLINEFDGRISTSLRGPEHIFKKVEPDNHSRVPLTVYVDRESDAALIEVGDERVILQPGEWSHFVQVDFEMLPLGTMNLSGICRFYLRSIEPEVEFYVSPINLSPEAPPAPVSEPESASADLVEGIGRYYTQGMAEDVNSLKNEILSDAEFMRQVELVYDERRAMMDYAIDEYVAGDEGGLLFFYFSTVDLSCHMMWRHFDSAHPAHEAEIASEDSSWWSGREGSTWKDTVHDLYLKMDPVLGRIRERLGDDITLIVMSDHGFAPYRRKFSINTWLVENGYLVLHEGQTKELPKDDPDFKSVNIYVPGTVDWSKTRAYGMGFNGLYLNLAGRELDNPATDEDESGIVTAAEAPALLREIKEKLEAIDDPETGLKAVTRCDLATDVYTGDRVAEAPDMLVGFSAGYGNSDPASTGRIPNAILEDNTGGTFNGSHLMAPEVVKGILISNQPIREGEHQLEDLTVEILTRFGVEKTEAMKGHPVLE